MKKSILLLLSCILLGLSGCSKMQDEGYSVSQDTIVLTPHETKFSLPVMTKTWNNDGGVVCVVFGYGFNGEFYNKSCEKIQEVYGLEDNSGLVFTLVFPNDFNNRISNLANLVEGKNLKGIIILGAPDYSHFAVGRLLDQWGGSIPFNVFSFFPQDDILGQEAVCNLVLENEMSHSEEIELKESEQVVDDSVVEILLKGISYIAQLPGPLTSSDDMLYHARQIVGQNRTHRFVDSETGLFSVNHFVIETSRK